MNRNSTQHNDLTPKFGSKLTQQKLCEAAKASRGPIEAVGKCAFVMNVIANAYHIDIEALQSSKRCRAPIAFARQAAMYLAHVSCGLSLTDVGRGFSRDRTTVAHACQRVEDRRDAPETDLALDYLEAAIVEWFGSARKRSEPAVVSSVAV